MFRDLCQMFAQRIPAFARDSAGSSQVNIRVVDVRPAAGGTSLADVLQVLYISPKTTPPPQDQYHLLVLTFLSLTHDLSLYLSISIYLSIYIYICY